MMMPRIWSRILAAIKPRRKKIAFSAIGAVMLTAIGYLMNNMPVFTGENMTTYVFCQLIKDKICPGKGFEMADSVRYVNIAYDHRLVPYIHDEVPVGKIDIVDRGKLLEFLKILGQRNRYRYIFLDLRFEDGCHTEVDSALFSYIGALDRIVVAKADENPMTDYDITHKIANARYYATIISTNFGRYEYIDRDGNPYMPLYALHELDGGNIRRFGPLYFDGHGLCQSTIFLRFSSDPFGPHITHSSLIELPYENLGADIIDLVRDSILTVDEVAQTYDSKYVVIGDMVNDMHDTYTGPKPGPMIIYNAYCQLKDGDNHVSVIQLLLLMAVYFLLILIIISGKPILEHLPLLRRVKWPLAHFMISFVGYSAILALVDLICFFLFDTIYSFMLPALLLSVLDQYVSYRKYKSTRL